jgi:hypothetical protein
MEKFKKELYENSFLIKIEKQIDYLEVQKRRLRVKELSFNSYYEFALDVSANHLAGENQFRHPGLRRHLEAVLPRWRVGNHAELRLDVNLFVKGHRL